MKYAVVYNGGNNESKYVGSLYDYKMREFNANPILMSEDEANELLKELDNYVRNVEFIGDTNEDNEQAHWAYEKHEWGFQIEELDVEDEYGMYTHCVRCRESGDVIEYTIGLDQAEDVLDMFEERDKEEGTYVENFYEIAEIPIETSARLYIGAVIAHRRFLCGMTQAQLAEATGLLQPNIARIENGRYGVTLDVLARIAQALGKTIDLV